ncbi:MULTISPECIES: DUF881 domain-containing protein [Rossellomorea]|jgi:uncharacterized protein YlxW (UPF0749 family)|uniref:DUF881 domain-containing protein n=1 Tax=Rossellomorea TaxID=2837508 RepID=UPI0011E8F6E0|nr:MULTISPECIES: DUF881 domain-containing protein [Rossellomorea]MDT9023836.1 DUF881 domain-containing protein [Rossellomorea sp. YC4-1]TYS91055.1 DUF881 domain-containing protein [Rossellomorea aquimaris]
MDNKLKISFTIITIIIGFMIAIQFQTVKEPVVRDTRDIWELRNALLKEKEVNSNLYAEMRAVEAKLEQYKTEQQSSPERALKQTLEELKTEAGLTEKTGPGVILTIEPAMEEILLGEKVQNISPELLERLVNELNRYDAMDISIDGHRLINTSVIRDINGETKVDGYSIEKIPFEVRVLTKDLDSAKGLYNRMQVSQSVEDFFIDNLRVSISKPLEKVVVPPYEDTIRVRLMEPVKERGGNG